jgi:membrane protein required for beta-lactamase induction
VSLLKDPLVWLLVFLAGFALCAWRIKHWNATLHVEPPPKRTTRLSTGTLVGGKLLSGTLVLVLLFLLYKTVFPVAVLASAVVCGAMWYGAYKYRIRPLVAAGLSPARGKALIVMQLLWVAPALCFVCLSLWGLYRGP